MQPSERVNQDFGLFVPDVGLIIVDGIGGLAAGDLAGKTAAKTVVDRSRALQLNRMPPDEAVDAVHGDVLPRVDFAIKEAAAEQAGGKTIGTTLGAALFGGRNNLIAVGVGGYARARARKAQRWPSGAVTIWFTNPGTV